MAELIDAVGDGGAQNEMVEPFDAVDDGVAQNEMADPFDAVDDGGAQKEMEEQIDAVDDGGAQEEKAEPSERSTGLLNRAEEPASTKIRYRQMALLGQIARRSYTGNILEPRSPRTTNFVIRTQLPFLQRLESLTVCSASASRRSEINRVAFAPSLARLIAGDRFVRNFASYSSRRFEGR